VALEEGDTQMLKKAVSNVIEAFKKADSNYQQQNLQKHLT
jgi:hypothetical protein